MMQEVEVLKTIPELVCSYFSEEQFTLSPPRPPFDFLPQTLYSIYVVPSGTRYILRLQGISF